ncbi:hypothetical protein TrVE_jg2541 [Triparma verrucosa]|uniref:Uncharacterized protein n=1 Tax=Triparma verrucosa TaxID=1606542 RepID=A0A9W7F553_9STRA|nr:hypothetical protein TrVE_jg2541 [Triparma verrucosa]
MSSAPLQNLITVLNDELPRISLPPSRINPRWTFLPDSSLDSSSCSSTSNIERAVKLYAQHLTSSGLPSPTKIVPKSPKVRYVPIYESPSTETLIEYEVCLFYIPPKKSIPLHDHPDMIVYSSLLSGDLSVTQMDARNWLSFLAPPKPRVFDAEVGACLTTLPRKGNLHQFETQRGCMILDVVTPGYVEGRECTYFREVGSGMVVEVTEEELGFEVKGGEIVGFEDGV